MTHVFIVDKDTFKVHLENLFAGTGAKDKTSPFLVSSKIRYPSTTERMLVGMVADIQRIRVNDNVIFYLQAKKNNPGRFYGVFKVASNPFFDENDSDNYLVDQLGKGLSFRVLIKPDVVYPKGLTEHELLDSLEGRIHPYDLCWSLIYRKLKGNRGCTMIMDYEYQDLLEKLKVKNDYKTLNSNYYSFDEKTQEIIPYSNLNVYAGRQQDINILPRMLFKAMNGNAFETHLQAYVTQNVDKDPLASLVLPFPEKEFWIGNEVSCGVGMQRIDVMIKQETDTDVYIKVIELKDENPYEEIITNQIPWYLEWLSYYVIPKYKGKKIHLTPTIIAKGEIPSKIFDLYKDFKYDITDVDVKNLQYIGFEMDNSSIKFNEYL